MKQKIIGNIAKCPWHPTGNVSKIGRDLDDSDFVGNHVSIRLALSKLVADPDIIDFLEGYEKKYTYIIVGKISQSVAEYLKRIGCFRDINTSSLSKGFLFDQDSFVSYALLEFGKSIDNYLSQSEDDELKLLIKAYEILRTKGARKAMINEMFDIKSALVEGFRPLVTTFFSALIENNSNRAGVAPQALKNAVLGLHYTNIDQFSSWLCVVTEIDGQNRLDEIKEIIRLILTNLQMGDLLFSQDNISFIFDQIIEVLTSRNIEISSPDDILLKSTIYGIGKKEYEIRAELSQFFLEEIGKLYNQGNISLTELLSWTSGELPNEKIYGCPVIPYFNDYWGVIAYYLEKYK